MRSRRAGLSLLEALFGMLISFMVLGAVTFVLQQSVATGSSLDEQGTLSEVAHVFSLLRRDLTGALTVTPGAGRLDLESIDPAQSFATRVSDGDPFSAGERVTTVWLYDQGVLARNSVAILTCAGFEAARDGSLVQVKLALVPRRATRGMQRYELECRVR